MANQQATLTNIPLTASLNLNKIECDIKPYSGFHDDNSLFIGGVKNNMYKKVFYEEDNGDRVYICHRNNKNFYAVNRGINNIAIIEEDVTTHEARVLSVIDSTKKFVKTEVGEYFPTYETSLIRPLSSETYIVNWMYTPGSVTLTITKNGDEATSVVYTLATAEKGVKARFVGNDIILFSIVDKYSAKEVTKARNVIYSISGNKFYANNITGEDKGFIWSTDTDARFIYIGISGSNSGYATLNASELEQCIVYNSNNFTIDLTKVNKSLVSNTSLYSDPSHGHSKYEVPVIRCNGKGIEVGIRCESSDIAEDGYMYFDKEGQSIAQTIGASFDLFSIPGDINYGLWSGGIKEPINDDFSIIFYSGVPFCISTRNNRIKVEHNIDEIIWEECTNTEVYYSFEGKKYRLALDDMKEKEVDYAVSNEYIFLNIDSPNNTINLSDGRVFNRSDDYIYLAIPYLKSLNAKHVDNDTYAQYATGYRVLFSRDNYSDIGMVLAPLNVRKTHTTESYSYYTPNGYDTDIMIFWGKTSTDSSAMYAPTYFTTLSSGYNATYENVYYPITSSNVIYNPNILDEVEDTYFDEYIFKDGHFTYISTRTQNQSIVLGYFIQTLAEFSKVFIIAGTHYGIQGNYIIRLGISNGQITESTPLVYIGDFEYVGATITEAFFWSPIDRSFYVLRGDLTITKFIESNRIKSIKKSFSQPSLSCVVCSTEDDELDESGNAMGSILFFYGEQMIRLPINTNNDIYYTNNSFVIDDTEYCFLKRDGYEKVPIEIETEYYSSAPFVDETNDCVYITLFDENPSKGNLELYCSTLKEGTFKSEKKIFSIAPNMFDKTQKYLRLRYQPQYQTGAFSLKIKSDFSIAGISISHRVNNVSNSHYND